MITLATLCVLFASQGPGVPATLQPRTYTSTAGAWTLYVDPSSRDGAGKSTMTVAKQGKVQWTAQKPFTFWEAAISDAGVCVGYGYTEGPITSRGDMVIAILGADGETGGLVDRTPRRGSRGPDGPAAPRGEGIALLEDRNRAIVRVIDWEPTPEQDEAWCVYQLSPAKKLDIAYARGQFEVPNQHHFSWGLAGVRGTPLTIARWYFNPWSGKHDSGPGSELALYDEAMKLVWTLPLPGDLKDAFRVANSEVVESLRSTGGFLDSTQKQRFEVRLYAQAERVTYEVARDESAAKGWTVREVARAAFRPAEPAAQPAAPSELQLPSAGTVRLAVGVGDAAGPVRKIQAFALGEKGQVTFVREEPESAASLVTLDAAGSVSRQVAVLPLAPGADMRPSWNALAGGDWLATVEILGTAGKTRVWRVSGKTGVATELPALGGANVEAVARAADGGYAILATQHGPFTMGSSVTRFAADGRRLWGLAESGEHEDPSALFSPEDVELGSDGSLMVLDSVRHLMQRFDPHGQFIDAIELEKSWSGEFMYPTCVVACPDGSVWVFDINDRTWHHLAHDGMELTKFSPRRENGDTDVGDASDACVDAEGRIWGCDQYEVLSFDEQGVAHGRFGSPPDPKRLGNPHGAFFDGRGLLIVEDEDTHSAHVFAPDGRRLLVCTPEPNDAGASDDFQEALTGPDGTLFVQLDRYADKWLAFGADGSREGAIELGGERVAFDRRSAAHWALGSKYGENARLRRLAADGTLEFETARRPDGGFFEGADAIACAPDGSVVVFDTSREAVILCFFGPKGEPLRQTVLPETGLRWTNHMQVGRRWIVLSSFEDRAVLFSIPDGKSFAFTASVEDQNSVWGFGLSPDEKELWALQSSPPTLRRFTLPQ